jgi:hypothetical protein
MAQVSAISAEEVVEEVLEGWMLTVDGAGRLNFCG